MAGGDGTSKHMLGKLPRRKRITRGVKSNFMLCVDKSDHSTSRPNFCFWFYFFSLLEAKSEANLSKTLVVNLTAVISSEGELLEQAMKILNAVQLAAFPLTFPRRVSDGGSDAL